MPLNSRKHRWPWCNFNDQSAGAHGFSHYWHSPVTQKFLVGSPAAARLAIDPPVAKVHGTKQVARRSLPMTGLKLPSALVLASIAICPVHAETGMASFYGGGHTASGETTVPTGLTAAHRTLPFGTNVLVTNVGNGKTVVVRIIDRGPFGRGRIIDVSRAAARELDMIDSGTIMVSVVRQ